VLLTDIDLASHDFFVDAFPHEAFRLLREHDPVHWQPEPAPNHGFWAITKYHDVETVIDDPATYSSERGGVILEEMAPDELDARKSMMETDPPRHTRMRKIASPLFTPRSMREYEGYCRDIARDVLDKALAKGEFDFVLDVAKELPIRVLVRILGVPDEDTDRLIEWGDTMIGNTDPEYTQFVIDRDDTSDYRLMPFRSPAAADMMNSAATTPRTIWSRSWSTRRSRATACPPATSTTSSSCWSSPATRRRATGSRTGCKR
jgi:cytochrome P450